jgi:hypothetical protein
MDIKKSKKIWAGVFGNGLILKHVYLMLKIHRPISVLQAGDLLTTFHPPLPLYI